ncbi:MAG: DUF4335 domain-containing protein [Calothrix sp. FI2-JRJ7]|jgi:hypothetical protein|nr:DUF4335 domain-containing protein [Calothrix sp. FI2-JRJ7]
MPLSNSVIRRYTPPTCTLEVSAQNSPLSQWMGKSVLKQLSFSLRLDDPRLPEDQRIAIRGNRDQLEALCAAVTAYVQQFLHTQPDKFWENYNNNGDVTQVFRTDVPQDVHNTDTRLSTLGKPYNTNNNQFAQSEIYIEPSGYLSHNLHLGNLASPTTGVVKLSLLQLFDLASALDEYSADVLALPNLNNTRRRTSAIPNWAPIAAVFALALGLTPFTLQYANRARQNQQSAANTSSEALQTPLPTVAATPGLLPTPLDTLPPIAAGLPTLPPGAVSTNLPIPGAIPTPGANINTSTLPTTNLPPGSIAGNLPVPSTTQRPNLGAPTTSQPGANFTFPSSIPSGNTLTIPELANPRLPTTSTGKTSPILTSPGSIALQPNITQQARSITQPRNNTDARGNIATSKSPSTTLPSTIPPISSISPISPTTGLPSLDALETPYNEPRPATPPANRTAPGGTDGSLLNRLREARDGSGRIATASNRSTTTATNTIFDTPQISEARNVLRATWKPPQGLKQTLEYSLLVGVDGSIERILPLGKAARDFVDRTGMPLIGEQFVSPNRNGQSVRIRAVFSPDGKVQTFPEKD